MACSHHSLEAYFKARDGLRLFLPLALRKGQQPTETVEVVGKPQHDLIMNCFALIAPLSAICLVPSKNHLLSCVFFLEPMVYPAV